MTAGALWIPRAVVDDLSRQAMDHATVETGGILLAEPAGDVVVLDTLGPGSQAVHTPSGFEPDQACTSRNSRSATGPLTASWATPVTGTRTLAEGPSLVAVIEPH